MTIRDPNSPNEGILDHILYVVVLPAVGAGEFSPFQGFSRNSIAAADAVLNICRLPATIEEVFIPRAEAIARRAMGFAGYAIEFLEVEFLHRFHGGLPYTCLVSLPSTGVSVQHHVEAYGR